MRCTIVLEFDNGEGLDVKRVELMRLHRDTVDPASGDVGLSLAEGKSLSNCVQQESSSSLDAFALHEGHARVVALIAACTTVVARS